MRRFYIVVLLAIFMPNFSLADQKSVLKSFEVIKANVETGINLRKYNELITDIKVEINLLKRDKKANSAFVEQAEKCLKTYQQAGLSWELKNDFERLKSHQNAAESDVMLQKKWKESSDCVDSLYD